MIRTVLLVAAIVSLAEGAALVRFINTVPTRFTDQSQGNLGTYLGSAAPVTKPLSNDASVITGRSDRVGLQYFSQTSGTVAAPTLVWTTIVNSPAETSVATSPYAWFEAMPALRGYHTIRTSTADEAAAVDQPFGSRTANAANLGLSPAFYDNYDQSRLRADGVGLYLSFAAGSYRMQAYAAISDSDATRLTATARPFTDSSMQITLEDNKVYTLIAYGVGKYAETTPLNGNTVRLTLFEESMAPVTFGMAAVRFFNGFAAAGVSVDVYSGTGVSDAARIASSIPVGGLSSYIDVTPGVQKEFPVAQTGSTSNYLASSTAVQRDVRAGSRTTIICAVNNEQSGAGFCRGIPSRVVAYVRFINDLTGQDSLVQGAFGAQKLSQTRLTLWASYEVPRPEILVEGSQVQGTQVVTGNPLTQEGLYPVIVSVAPGTVTGYGEVFVPVFIMDYAVRREIVYNPTNAANPSLTTNPSTNDLSYVANPPTTSYIFAPIYKRVHFVIKTDGYATLSARQGTDAAGDIYEWPTVGTSQTMKGVSTAGLPPDTGNQNGAKSFTTDEYVEPGEYYSVIATTGALPANAPVYAYQRSDIFAVYYRRDRTVDSISGGIQSGKGILSLIPFANQNWATSAFSLQQGTTTTTPTMATVGVTTAVAATAGPVAFPASLPNEIQLNTGAYTYSAAATTACETTIPTTPTGITIADGQIYDLFVLNVFGCNVNGPSVSRLNVIVQQRGAVASANAPATSRRHAVPMAL